MQLEGPPSGAVAVQLWSFEKGSMYDGIESRSRSGDVPPMKSQIKSIIGLCTIRRGSKKQDKKKILDDTNCTIGPTTPVRDFQTPGRDDCTRRWSRRRLVLGRCKWLGSFCCYFFPSLFGLLLTIGTNENAAYAWPRDIWPATGGAGVLTKPQNVEAVVDRHDYDIPIRGEGRPRLACCRRQCL